MVTFATLVAYSFEVTGHQPFILTGETAQGLPPVRLPPFSVVTANRTVSFAEMVQVCKAPHPRCLGMGVSRLGPGNTDKSSMGASDPPESQLGLTLRGHRVLALPEPGGVWDLQCSWRSLSRAGVPRVAQWALLEVGEPLTWSPLLLQDMGAGLAVVPLVGLLESVAVAKAFGEMPHALQVPTAHTPPEPLLSCVCLLSFLLLSALVSFCFLFGSRSCGD